jgi:hypothetical protein
VGLYRETHLGAHISEELVPKIQEGHFHKGLVTRLWEWLKSTWINPVPGKNGVMMTNHK